MWSNPAPSSAEKSILALRDECTKLKVEALEAEHNLLDAISEFVFGKKIEKSGKEPLFDDFYAHSTLYAGTIKPVGSRDYLDWLIRFKWNHYVKDVCLIGGKEFRFEILANPEWGVILSDNFLVREMSPQLAKLRTKLTYGSLEPIERLVTVAALEDEKAKHEHRMQAIFGLHSKEEAELVRTWIVARNLHNRSTADLQSKMYERDTGRRRND